MDRIQKKIEDYGNHDPYFKRNVGEYKGPNEGLENRKQRRERQKKERLEAKREVKRTSEGPKTEEFTYLVSSEVYEKTRGMSKEETFKYLCRNM